MERVAGTPDSFVIRNFIRDEVVIEQLESEIQWPERGPKGAPRAVFQAMYDGADSYAYLRCPSIQPEKITGFSPTVAKVVEAVNVMQKVNIVKVLKYNSGNKALKNHADKIIDLAEGSNIYTLRLGSTRTMLLKHKETGEEFLVDLPHNTLFILGWETNRYFTHGVPPANGLVPSYSIVLRTSVTWLHRPTLGLWGPRTRFPCPEKSSPMAENTDLVRLWGEENQKVVSLDHYASFFAN
jgi:alkylated DNA repair dioxygenase AlkB